MSLPLIVHCDARVSALGVARLGWVISDGTAILSHGTESPPGSWDNNTAEMLAVLSGARALAEQVAARFGSVTEVAVVSDSTAAATVLTRLRDGQHEGRGHLLTVARAVIKVCKNLPPCRFVWVPREMNRAADWLTREPCPARRPLPVPPPLPPGAVSVSRETAAPTTVRLRKIPTSPKARHPLSPARCGWSSARASGLVTLGEALGIKAEDEGEEP